MKTHLHKDFSTSWHSLTRGDAAAKLAYQKVAGALQVWEHDDKTYLQVTHHGESRIQHCVKYDLGSGYRLVTVEHEGQRHLLFVGTHDETDRWVDKHVGIKPTVNARGRVSLVMQNSAAKATQAVRDKPLQAFDTATGTVWDGIPEAARDSLNKSSSHTRIPTGSYT